MNVNFDDFVVASDLVGFGSVAREDCGEVIASAFLDTMVALSLMIAEALSFRWSLSLALHLCFRQVCFETNCVLLFEA